MTSLYDYISIAPSVQICAKEEAPPNKAGKLIVFTTTPPQGGNVNIVQQKSVKGKYLFPGAGYTGRVNGNNVSLGKIWHNLKRVTVLSQVVLRPYYGQYFIQDTLVFWPVPSYLSHSHNP